VASWTIRHLPLPTGLSPLLPSRLVTPLPSPQVDPGNVHQATRDILGRAEFRPPRRSLPSAAWHWISTQIGKLLGHLFGLGGGRAVTGAVVGAALLALVGFMVWLAVRHWTGLGSRASAPAFSVATGWRARSSAEWRAEAAALEAAGRWREALRARYRALVADLAGRGLVEEIPGRTAGEYRRMVDRTAPAVAAPFDEATGLFEETWYGARHSGPDDQARFDQLAGRVLAGSR
jgi:Domain of unknown function (DUF4129)